ncbi:MAG: hypothetical protein ACK5VZ_03505 [Alphaproteobacteria bacterium]
MRIIIDISKDQINVLDELSRLEETSRVALIRLAIDQFLARQTHEERARELAFGIWKDWLEKAKSARRDKRESTPAAPSISEVRNQISDGRVLPPTERAAEGVAGSRSPSGGEQGGGGGESPSGDVASAREQGGSMGGNAMPGYSGAIPSGEGAGTGQGIAEGEKVEPGDQEMAASAPLSLPAPSEPLETPAADIAPPAPSPTATLNSVDPLTAFFLAGRGTR